MRTTALMKEKGWTIVQKMVILFIVGIVGAVVVNYLIDKRCLAEPAKQMCVERNKTK